MLRDGKLLRELEKARMKKAKSQKRWLHSLNTLTFDEWATRLN